MYLPLVNLTGTTVGLRSPENHTQVHTMKNADLRIMIVPTTGRGETPKARVTVTMAETFTAHEKDHESRGSLGAAVGNRETSGNETQTETGTPTETETWIDPKVMTLTEKQEKKFLIKSLVTG